MAAIDAEQVRQLVKEQLENIQDEVVRAAIEKLLVDPFRHFVEDTTLSETFLCWVVANDPESSTYFVYCAEYYGLASIWGIVSAATLETTIDSNWHGSLEDAFYESFAAAPLSIWNVVKCNPYSKDRVVAESLTYPQADELIAKLNTEQGIQPNGRRIYGIEPRTRIWW